MEGKGLSIRKKSKSIFTNEHRYRIPELVKLLVEQADILIEVLDARFIEKTRNKELEKDINGLGKKIIYVFNKADLVDLNNLLQKVEVHELIPHVFFSNKNKKGLDELRELIKKEANKMNKGAVNLGVIGYPNTGKSSVINILSGRAVARTSSQAGFTKGLQKVKLSPGIYLIDTPGLIPLKEKERHQLSDKLKHSTIGVKTWDRAEEPELAIARIMVEYPGLLEKYYKIDADNDPEILIEKLGRRLNYLKKGNLVNEDRTARHILRDWQEGRIRIY